MITKTRRNICIADTLGTSDSHPKYQEVRRPSLITPSLLLMPSKHEGHFSNLAFIVFAALSRRLIERKDDFSQIIPLISLRGLRVRRRRDGAGGTSHSSSRGPEPSWGRDGWGGVGWGEGGQRSPRQPEPHTQVLLSAGVLLQLLAGD